MKTSAGTTLMLAVAALVAFCSPTSADGPQVPTGEWGGEHVALSVTSTSVKVEFDCAHGTIEGPITLDANGRFEVKGTFVPERGGPEREGQQETGLPAKFSGTLKDGTLTVTVELTETKYSVGVYTMTRGGTARLFKCK